VPLARTYSVALIGVTEHVVEIEADIANGLVGMILVGLPDTALREARDRIRAAIANSGEQWPQRKITVGLSCPARKQDWAGDLLVFRASCGVRVFVDQSAQDRFSADLLCVYAGHGGARSVRFAVGDALGDALVRPGRVVVRLVLGQDGAQMPLAEDQHPVEEFPAQGADEALADRVAPHRQLHLIRVIGSDVPV
jgi:magnesium chelatase family protein